MKSLKEFLDIKNQKHLNESFKSSILQNAISDLNKTVILNNLNSFNNKINNYNAVRINTYLKNKLSFSRFGINYGELYKLNKSKIFTFFMLEL